MSGKRIRAKRNNTTAMQLYNHTIEWLAWFKEQNKIYNRNRNNNNLNLI